MVADEELVSRRLIDRDGLLRGGGEGWGVFGQPGAARSEAGEGVEQAEAVFAGCRQAAAQGGEVAGPASECRQPEIFCRSLTIRMSRSDPLLSRPGSTCR